MTALITACHLPADPRRREITGTAWNTLDSRQKNEWVAVPVTERTVFISIQKLNFYYTNELFIECIRLISLKNVTKYISFNLFTSAFVNCCFAKEIHTCVVSFCVVVG